MTLWTHEAVRVTGGGALEVVHLTIRDDDPLLVSREGGVTWQINGASLASLPNLFLGTISFAVNRGPLVPGTQTGLRFQLGDDTYYLFGNSVAPAGVAAITGFAPSGTVAGVDYVALGFSPDRQTPRNALALVRELDDTGDPVALVTATDVLFDDDGLVQSDGTGAVAASETGAPALLQLGATGAAIGFARLIDDDGFGLCRVRVVLQTLSGPQTAEGLRLTVALPGGGLAEHYYLPGVRPTTATAIDSVEVLGPPLPGTRYDELGFGLISQPGDGGAGADAFSGGVDADDWAGKGGADRGAGGFGNDILAGGTGNDRLFGGMHDDILFGQADDDTLFGGSGGDSLDGGTGRDRIEAGFGEDRVSGDTGADVLIGDAGDDRIRGGAGGDRLFGGKGDDRLDGEEGDDRLTGGDGRDRLTDGGGRDTLFGGLDEDVFVLKTDGAVDIIADFVDGADRIAIDSIWDDTDIVHIRRGEVEVRYGDERLIVRDTAGVLTAAMLTAEDFS